MEGKLTAVKVLEVHTKPIKDGKGPYHSLICFEPGKGPFGLVNLNLKETDIAKAKQLVDKTADIEVNIFMGKDYTSLSFVSGSVVKQGA